MENKTLTAVDWLVQEINKLTGLKIAPDEPIIEQAKAMEKQQIKFAYNDGADDTIEKRYKGMDEYYNKMYNHE